MASDASVEPIPHPPGHLFVGNLFDVDADNTIESLMGLAREYGPIYRLDVPGDMTRLTLDTIALCGFNYRVDSFYRETPHPFVLAMLGSLEAAQAQARKLPIQQKLNRKPSREARADRDLMAQTVQRIIQERRESGATGTVNDLLDRMLTGVERQSGEQLDETNMIAQCITFLVAGHETTSGLLSSRCMPCSRARLCWSGRTMRWTACWALT